MKGIYADVNFVTALVPSDTACLASSPGRIRRTAVWISLDVTVGFLLYLAREAVSTAIFSKMSAMNEFRIDIAFEEIPVSGWTCFKTCGQDQTSQRCYLANVNGLTVQAPIRLDSR